jgi:hypothetical protein
VLNIFETEDQVLEQVLAVSAVVIQVLFKSVASAEGLYWLAYLALFARDSTIEPTPRVRSEISQFLSLLNFPDLFRLNTDFVKKINTATSILVLRPIIVDSIWLFEYLLISEMREHLQG